MKIGTVPDLAYLYGDNGFEKLKEIGFDGIDFRFGIGYFNNDFTFQCGNDEVKKRLVD